MCKKCVIVTIIFLLAVAAGFFIVLNTKAQNPFYVVINEIAWMGSEVQGVESKNWWRYEWFELHNASDQPVILNGWTLELYGDQLDWKLELNGTIAPQNYFLVAASDKIPYADFNYSKLDGKFQKSGQRVLLKDANGTIIDDIDARSGWFAGDNETKQTMERKNPELSGSSPASWATSLNPGGTLRAINSVHTSNNQPSSGASEQKTNDDSEQSTAGQNTNTANAPTNPNIQDEQVIHGAQIRQNENTENDQQTDGTILKDNASSPSNATSSLSNDDQNRAQIVYTSNIHINEIMPSPTGDDSLEEWIEITNENEESVDISGFRIRDANGIINTYTMPTGSIIGAGGFFVLSRPTTNITLNNDSDGLEFLKPNGEVFQRISYEGPKKGFAYLRSNDKWSWTNVPTPGSINILSQPQKEKVGVKNINNIDESPKKAAKPIKDASIAGILEPLNSTSTDSALSQNTASLIDSTLEPDETGNGNNNAPVILLALLIAAVSGCAMFILKKRAIS